MACKLKTTNITHNLSTPREKIITSTLVILFDILQSKLHQTLFRQLTEVLLDDNYCLVVDNFEPKMSMIEKSKSVKDPIVINIMNVKNQYLTT